MSSGKIPTYDVFLDGKVDPIAKGIHKNQVNKITADFDAQGIGWYTSRSKSVKSSKYSKSRKDREL